MTEDRFIPRVGLFNTAVNAFNPQLSRELPKLDSEVGTLKTVRKWKTRWQDALQGASTV